MQGLQLLKSHQTAGIFMELHCFGKTTTKKNQTTELGGWKQSQAVIPKTVSTTIIQTG